MEASSWAFHDADAFEEAVMGIVIQAEDADTTGAICGSSDLCNILRKSDDPPIAPVVSASSPRMTALKTASSKLSASWKAHDDASKGVPLLLLPDLSLLLSHDRHALLIYP